MGVLDELRKEAQSVRAREQEKRSEEERREEEALRRLRPRMRALYEFLKEMCENLNVVDPDVRTGYEVEGFGRLTGLRQCEYRVSTPDNRALREVTLHFKCRAEGTIKFQIRNKEAAERQRQRMWGYGLRFTSKSLADDSSVFFLEAMVPVALEFDMVPGDGVVRLRARNFDYLGVNTTRYRPEQLTDELFEELGKAILRKPNRFQELSGNALTEEMRRRLRQQLAHDRYRKKVEKVLVKEEPQATTPGAVPAGKGGAGEVRRRPGLLKGLFGKGGRAT